jgi:hypothetical protein
VNPPIASAAAAYVSKVDDQLPVSSTPGLRVSNPTLLSTPPYPPLLIHTLLSTPSYPHRPFSRTPAHPHTRTPAHPHTYPVSSSHPSRSPHSTLDPRPSTLNPRPSPLAPRVQSSPVPTNRHTTFPPHSGSWGHRRGPLSAGLHATLEYASLQPQKNLTSSWIGKKKAKTNKTISVILVSLQPPPFPSRLSSK